MLLNSPYFSELTQYGVPHAPVSSAAERLSRRRAPPAQLSWQDTTERSGSLSAR